MPILPAALTVVTLQGLTACKPRSQNIPGVTSRVQPGAPRLDAATRRQVLTDVAATIRDHYADREVGDTLAATLMHFQDVLCREA